MKGSRNFLFRPPRQEDRSSPRIASADKVSGEAAGDGRLIEDYALVGDRKTAALVSQAGAVDWLCLPRFDSPAFFASLLGDVRNGSWSIAPTDQDFSSWRRYDDGSVILRTTFEAKQGAVELIDFMPEGFDRSHFIRIVRGIRGRLEMRCKIAARFDYGVTIPWVTEIDHHTYSFVAGAEVLALRTPVQLDLDEGDPETTFEVAKGECLAFVLSHGSSHQEIPPAIDVEESLRQTRKFWSDWSGRCGYDGRHADIVKRSLITLKSLSYQPTGGIVAAPTTSLPEFIGGERNWDYRYCWLRDATFTLLAFLNAGYEEEAIQWRDWLLRAVAGSPEQIQIMYGVSGERLLHERSISWLPGYCHSAPVRVGNAASTQLQLDIYGELSDAMSAAAKGGLAPLPHGLELRTLLLDHLAQICNEPDEGIWEIRGEPRHFTHSKVMAWVAFDRAARGDNKEEDLARRRHYQALADRIFEDICSRAVDPSRNCFVQSYGSTYLDASLLLLPIVGFLPADDERMRNTVTQIEKHLMSDGFVLRYETDSDIDGLPPGEGVFVACSFWLVDNYVLQGRLGEAEALFDRLVGITNDVGLLAEEYDPANRRFLGNFPQAFSHVALVNSAFALARAKEGRPLDREAPVLEAAKEVCS
jgi:GH15 family glucan-1,4-alpha-glucosidase